MTENDDSFKSALEILRFLPPDDVRLLDACRRLGEITHDLQNAMASETDLESTCEVVEDRTRQAAGFLIEVLRLAHNL
jgi:hypothetical protein